MKSKSMKRVLALLLAVTMLCSLSAAAFADGEEPVIPEETVTEEEPASEQEEAEGDEIAAPVISFVEGSGLHPTETTGEVKFISDSEGFYYYKVLYIYGGTPTIDTETEGTAMVAGENTISLTGINGMNQRVFVVAKNAGGVSAMIQMDLPNYDYPAPFVKTAEEGNKWTVKHTFVAGESWQYADDFGNDLFNGNIVSDPAGGTLSYYYWREDTGSWTQLRQVTNLNTMYVTEGLDLVFKLKARSTVSQKEVEFEILYDGLTNLPPVRKEGIPEERTETVEFVVGSQNNWRLDGLTEIWEDPNGLPIKTVVVAPNNQYDKGYFKPSVVGEEATITYVARDPVGGIYSPDTYTVHYLAVQPYAWPKIVSIGTEAMKAEAEDGTVRNLMPVQSVEIQNKENLEYTNFTTASYTTGEWELGTVVITLDGEEPASLENETPFMDLSAMTFDGEGSPKTVKLVYANENNPTKLYLNNGDNFNEYYNIQFKFTQDTKAPVLTLVSGTHNHKNTAQVVFRANEAGTYYYATAAANAEAPDIEMSGAGTEMVKGQNTLDITGLTTDGLKVYIKAVDETGNSMTEAFTVDIPEYVMKKSSFSFSCNQNMHNTGRPYAITRFTVNGEERTLMNSSGGNITYQGIEEGSEVHIWLSNLPQNYLKLEDVFLSLSSDPVNSRVETTIHDDNSFSFIMPDENVVGERATRTQNVLYKELKAAEPRWEYYYLAVADPALYTLEKATITMYRVPNDYHVDAVTVDGVAKDFDDSYGTVTISDVPAGSEVCIRFGGLTAKGEMLKDAVLCPTPDQYSRVEETVNAQDNSIRFTMPGIDLRDGLTGTGRIVSTLGYEDWFVVEQLTAPTISEIAGGAVRTGKTDGEIKLESSFDGVYYYSFTENMDTAGEGAVLSKGANTLNITGLEGRQEQTVYIVGKTAEGTLTNKLSITIPAYTVTTANIALEAVAEPNTIEKITVNGEETVVKTEDFGDGTFDFTAEEIPEGSTVQVYFTPKPGYKLAEVKLVPELEVTVAEDNSFSFVMPGENVVGAVVDDWDGNWYKLEMLPASAAVVGASLTLEGQIGLNFKLTFNEAALADEGAYVQYTFKNTAGEKLYIKDAPTDVKDGVTRYVFTQTLAAKEMTELVTIRVYNGDGTLMKLTNSAGTELANDEGSYSVAHYTQQVSDNTAALAKAMSTYGAYSVNYFNYTPVNPDEAYASAVAMNPVSGGYADLDAYKATMNGTLPAGIKVSTISLNHEAKTEIFIYLTLSEGHGIGEYTFTLDGQAVTPEPVDSRYRVVVPNIPAKDLDSSHTLNISGCEVKVTALSYAYSILKQNSDGTTPICNLVRALKAYNDAANAYFGD